MKRIILLVFLPIFFLSCEDEMYSTVPYRKVNIELHLNFEDMNLTAPLAYKTFLKPRKASDEIGFGGVVVIHGWGSNPINLYAFDLACPMEAPDTLARIIPDDEGYATCSKCKAKYNIAIGDGRPVSGGGTRYLRSYKVASTGSNTYLVRN